MNTPDIPRILEEVRVAILSSGRLGSCENATPLRKPGRLQVTSKLALAPGWPPALQPPDRLPLAALRADTSLRESNRFRDGCSKLPPGMQPLGPAGTIFPHRLTAPRASLCNPAAAPLPLALSSSSVGMRGGLVRGNVLHVGRAPSWPTGVHCGSHN